MVTSPHRCVRLVWCVSAGLLLGLATATLSLMLTGSGDGWVSALWGASAIILAPGATCAWLLRHRPGGGRALLCLLALALVLDGVIVGSTLAEGTQCFEHARAAVPGMVILWFALLSSWQVLLIAGLVPLTLRSEVGSERP